MLGSKSTKKATATVAFEIRKALINKRYVVKLTLLKVVILRKNYYIRIWIQMQAFYAWIYIEFLHLVDEIPTKARYIPAIYAFI